jgi:hypothetical protein
MNSQVQPASQPGFVSGFLAIYGKRILYAIIAYIIFRILASMFPGFVQKKGQRVPLQPPKESFHPREQADPAWERVPAS